ncbi:glycosyltransferase family 90 protein [Mycena latifolia]|nr:glycosyltransferase family 90 protein [Mycena latifolia]
MDPCQHFAHLAAHGQYLVHGARSERTNERLQWRGDLACGGRALARGARRVSMNVSVLRVPDAGDNTGKPGTASSERTRPMGAPTEVPRARYMPALMDVAFADAPLNGDATLFEFRAPHDFKTAGRYKYVLDVDGNGWSSRFKRLMNAGSLIFKATAYPEWCVSPFLLHIPPHTEYGPQNSYANLLDALVFFRGDPAGAGAHDDMARRIAGAGREWSRWYWRKEDLVA